MSYSSCSCFCLLDRTIQICESCFRAVKIWCFEYNSLILTTGCSTWHLMAKKSLRIWELELLLSIKMAEAIRSSVTAWNRVTVQWPGSYRGFPRWVSLRTGLARVDQRSWVLVLCVRCRSWLQKQTHECCQHCFRGCRSGRSACQCSDHTPHTATSRFAWPSSQKEASSEAGSQKSLQTVCWRQPGQEHELLEPCPVVWWV